MTKKSGETFKYLKKEKAFKADKTNFYGKESEIPALK